MNDIELLIHLFNFRLMSFHQKIAFGLQGIGQLTRFSSPVFICYNKVSDPLKIWKLLVELINFFLKLSPYFNIVNHKLGRSPMDSFPDTPRFQNLEMRNNNSGYIGSLKPKNQTALNVW